MTRRLEHTLDKDSITSIAKTFGFPEKKSVEKFVMDFELQSHIAERLDCVVRGGMCMPFYADSSARRVSVDVDLLTASTVEQAAAAVEQTDLSGEGVRFERHFPRHPYPMENLLTYNAHFGSSFGKDETVKVDIFCDAQIEPGVTTIRAGFPVIGFETPRDIKVLSRSWLLGDKMSSLSLNTVGLKQKIRGGRPKPQTEIAKQVYDMAVLLRSMPEREVGEALDAFKGMTGLKAAKFDGGRYSVSEIAADLAGSASSLIDLAHAVTLTSKQQDLYRNFYGTYMSKNSGYRKTAHVTDILMICVLAKAALDCESRGTGRDEAAARAHEAIAGAIKSEGDPKGSGKITDGPYAKVLKSALPEHAILVRAAGGLFG